MIGRLRGELANKQPPWLLVDVGGVAYEVEAPMSTIFNLPNTGQTVTLYTHLAVREDAQQLFGFATLGERDLFRVLIRINGVGGKLALAILSTLSATEFSRVVEAGDVAALTRVPGVGKKTAERLVVDMRGRTEALLAGSGPATPGAAANAPAGPESDAIGALVALGYKPAEAQRMVKSVADPDADSEALIRAALKTAMR